MYADQNEVIYRLAHLSMVEWSYINQMRKYHMNDDNVSLNKLHWFFKNIYSHPMHIWRKIWTATTRKRSLKLIPIQPKLLKVFQIS